MRKDKTQRRHWCKETVWTFTLDPCFTPMARAALSPWCLWLTPCPTCYPKAWKGPLCPAGLIPFIISSTFIRRELLLFIKERTMTPIYTQLNTLAILREWLLTPFYKEPVGLKHENSHPISFPSPSQAKE